MRALAPFQARQSKCLFVPSAQHLTGIDDQISEPASRCQKLSNHNAHKTQADVHFHTADDHRYAGGKDDFKERMPSAAVERVYEFDFLPVNGGKTGVQIHNASEHGHRHAGHDDRDGSRPEPHDEKRRES